MFPVKRIIWHNWPRSCLLPFFKLTINNGSIVGISHVNNRHGTSHSMMATWSLTQNHRIGGGANIVCLPINYQLFCINQIIHCFQIINFREDCTRPLGGGGSDSSGGLRYKHQGQHHEVHLGDKDRMHQVVGHNPWIWWWCDIPTILLIQDGGMRGICECRAICKETIDEDVHTKVWVMGRGKP